MWLKVSILRRKKHCPAPAEPETRVSPGSCSGRARGGSWGWQYPFSKSSSWHWDLGTRNSISSCWSEEHTPSSSALWRFSALTLLSNLNFFKRNMLLVHGAANKSIIGKFINAAAELLSRDDSLYWWGVSEWRIMRRTFRLIQGWREAHIRNIKYELAPLIHHKCLI